MTVHARRWLAATWRPLLAGALLAGLLLLLYGRFVLQLSDDTPEALRPDTLFVGQQNVLYCRVKGGTFPARFIRAAYYQLAQYVEEDDGAFYLPLNGRNHVIRAEN